MLSIIGLDGLPIMLTKIVNIRWFDMVLVLCHGNVVKIRAMAVLIPTVAQEVAVLYTILLVVVVMVDDQRRVPTIDNRDGLV